MDVSIDQDMSVPMEINVDHQREKPLSNFQPPGFYMDSEEHTGNRDSGLNNRFHMQDASSLYALGQVDEALNILEKQGCTSASALPFRLRAILTERLKSNNSVLTASCFEDALKKDPTCCESLAKLMKMHQNGNYNVESLVEMIASHMDATDAEHNIWKLFASCFLILFSYEEDCISTCFNGSENEHGKHVRSFASSTPKAFTGKPWRLRKRWWKTRYFGSKNLKSEIRAGDLQLLTYKAACASYIYGGEFPYVVEAYSHLEKQDENDLLSFLDNHRRNSNGFYNFFLT